MCASDDSHHGCIYVLRLDEDNNTILDIFDCENLKPAKPAIHYPIEASCMMMCSDKYLLICFDNGTLQVFNCDTKTNLAHFNMFLGSLIDL